MDQVKKCPCSFHSGERILSVSMFGKHRLRFDGLQTWCKKCICTIRQTPEYKAADRIRQQSPKRKAAARVRKYGLSLEQYDKMVLDQKGLCACCGKIPSGKKGFHVDHCHTSGKLRSLLCRTCNLMLGMARDCPEILRAAADYLEKHQV